MPLWRWLGFLALYSLCFMRASVWADRQETSSNSTTTPPAGGLTSLSAVELNTTGGTVEALTTAAGSTTAERTAGSSPELSPSSNPGPAILSTIGLPAANTADDRPACVADVLGKAIYCDAWRLDELPPEGLPCNISQLYVTTEEVQPDLTKVDNITRTLSDRNLTGLFSLKRLTLSHFGVEQIQNRTFLEVPLLEALDLSRNRIEVLHELTFFGLSRLVTLNLSYNEILLIRPEYFNLPSLKHLDLAHNSFSTLPDAAFRLLPVLHSLVLDGNFLGGLSSGEAFSGLQHLRALYMRRCHQQFPHYIFDHAQSVETLDLSLNDLQHIPSAAVKHLYFLQVLILSSNHIEYLPNQVLHGLALRRIDLSNNSISSIAKFAFQNFRTEELDLRGNNLATVPGDAFKLLARGLLVLDLSNNRLKTTQVVLPHELLYLQTLNLSRTGLTHLPPSLRHLYQLQTLDVSHNRIVSLNESETRLVRRLETVYLSGNPWRCDCQVKGLREWLLHQRYLPTAHDHGGDLEGEESGLGGRERETRSGRSPARRAASAGPTCATPPSLAGTLIAAVPEAHLTACVKRWSGAAPVAVYLLCSLTVLGILLIGVFLWRRRHEMTYGRFCGDKDDPAAAAAMTGSPGESRGRAHSPIKVISNPAAGASDLPRRQGQGPVKNQAWESALVISNPSMHLSQGDSEETQFLTDSSQQNGRIPGAETVV